MPFEGGKEGGRVSEGGRGVGALCAPDLSVHRFLIKRGQASGTCCGLGVYEVFFIVLSGVRFYFRSACSLIEEMSLCWVKNAVIRLNCMIQFCNWIILLW